MKLNILGSGGVIAPPRPTCQCRVCKEAREKGIPYARTGCSLFVYGINLLFDMPEEIRIQLNREHIERVEHVILTHWHPDHTLGLRVLELLNFDFFSMRPIRKPINLYMPKKQIEMFRKLSCGSFLDFYKKRECIKLIGISGGSNIRIGNINIKPVKFQGSEGFYFVINDGVHKIIYAPCEFKGFKIPENARNANILIAHNLWWENWNLMPHGKKRWEFMDEEDSFESMLKEASNKGIKKVILTHIEEIFGKSHDELNRLAKELYSGQDITFAYDGMIIEL